MQFKDKCTTLIFSSLANDSESHWTTRFFHNWKNTSNFTGVGSLRKSAKRLKGNTQRHAI